MRPLADILRPETIDDVVGQSHLVGAGKVFRRLVEKKRFPSIILYGPTGCGKTTLARILADVSGLPVVKLNATTAGTADVKAAIAENDSFVLILDEIQNFNKKQQQTLLDYMESGRVTLIAMTTENPHFYIIDAIMSRSVAFECKKVTAEEMKPVISKAIEYEESELGCKINLDAEALEKLCSTTDGDVRRALNLLEITLLSNFNGSDEIIIDESMISSDKGEHALSEDEHFNLMSCLQKSIRGSDPDAAIIYLARLLSTGDFLTACRRLTVIASEDVGLANPNAIVIVNACVEAAMRVGLPEARIPLAQATIYLATSPKSNSAYMALNKATGMTQSIGISGLPDFIRNPKTYKYPHDFKNNWVKQRYKPKNLESQEFYCYGDNKLERATKEYWDRVKE